MVRLLTRISSLTHVLDPCRFKTLIEVKVPPPPVLVKDWILDMLFDHVSFFFCIIFHWG